MRREIENEIYKMHTSVCDPLYLFTTNLIFFLMIDYGNTGDSFECQSRMITAMDTILVNMTCCVKVELGAYTKIYWRKYDDAIAQCIRESNDPHNVIC